MKEIKLDQKPDQKLLQVLEGKQFHIDSLGRIVIEDPTILAGIQGAYDGGLNEMPDPFWNGACSNQSC